VLASATLTPTDGFAAACGLTDGEGLAPIGNLGSGRRPDGQIDDVAVGTTTATSSVNPRTDKTPPDRLGKLTKRDTKKLYRQLTSAAELLRVEEAREAATPALLRAHAPWRDGTYAIAFDTRVDTTFQHRSRFYALTADTIRELQRAAKGPVAAFFPSYAYAEAIRDALRMAAPAFRVAVQPKVRDLAAQASWVDESLLAADALFLVLGSSFAESIDALGGRITHAMVVGPALPEVNAVQRARLEEARRNGADRDASFRQVYQIPGMTKVNQALGRLVRAPGQRTAVLLHCRRFAEHSYRELLAPEYRVGRIIHDDGDLAAWLA
jgi:Rad3-related DNA helicase